MRCLSFPFFPFFPFFPLHCAACPFRSGGPLDLDRSWDGLFQPFPCIQRRRPSPNRGWVGDHIGRFEACSTFTGYYGLSARCIAYYVAIPVMLFSSIQADYAIPS